MYKISIIIPHYNIPNLLSRCITSIPERDDIQIIVVDDQSPKSVEYMTTVPELSRKNVEFYVVDEKKGAGHARNIGLSHASGKWLIFADADDFFTPEFSSLIEKYYDAPMCVDLICFNVNSCYDNDLNKPAGQSKDYLFEKAEEMNSTNIFRTGYGEPWGKMYRADFIKNNNILFQETKANNDLLFSMKAGILARDILIDKSYIYTYVWREGSLSKSGIVEPLEKSFDRIKAFHAVQMFVEGEGLKTKLYLPLIPSLPILKRDLRLYFRLLQKMHSSSMRCYKMIIDTMRFLLCRAFGGYKEFSISDLVILNDK